MSTPTHEVVANYLIRRASARRTWSENASGTVEQLYRNAESLEALAEFVRNLADTNPRLLTLATLAVRDSEFVPGPGTEHALSQFGGTSAEACDAFLDSLVRTARDDALIRAREHGHLPPERPR
jgi:hypothetical protein